MSILTAQPKLMLQYLDWQNSSINIGTYYTSPQILSVGLDDGFYIYHRNY